MFLPVNVSAPWMMQPGAFRAGSKPSLKYVLRYEVWIGAMACDSFWFAVGI